MKRTTVTWFVAVMLAVGAGYWAGQRKRHPEGTQTSVLATRRIPPAPATMAATARPSRCRSRASCSTTAIPMGLPDTSPVPKKDSMGMDYIAVYEGEDDAASGAAGEVKISTEKVQKLGVKTEAAALRELTRQVRAAGRIEIDERRVHTVSAKFEGWIERLHVNATGQPVAKGQAAVRGV
jgi:Cu(I)/Ag(I) efflux system membrane fusion protein